MGQFSGKQFIGGGGKLPGGNYSGGNYLEGGGGGNFPAGQFSGYHRCSVNKSALLKPQMVSRFSVLCRVFPINYLTIFYASHRLYFLNLRLVDFP